MTNGRSHELSIDQVNTVTGGSGVRNAIKVLKSTEPVHPLTMMAAQSHLDLTQASITKPRRWLGGSSISQRIELLMR
jgi:hypothetical protein